MRVRAALCEAVRLALFGRCAPTWFGLDVRFGLVWPSEAVRGALPDEFAVSSGFGVRFPLPGQKLKGSKQKLPNGTTGTLTTRARRAATGHFLHAGARPTGMRAARRSGATRRFTESVPR